MIASIEARRIARIFAGLVLIIAYAVLLELPFIHPWCLTVGSEIAALLVLALVAYRLVCIFGEWTHSTPVRRVEVLLAIAGTERLERAALAVPLAGLALVLPPLIDNLAWDYMCSPRSISATWPTSIVGAISFACAGLRVAAKSEDLGYDTGLRIWIVVAGIFAGLPVPVSRVFGVYFGGATALILMPLISVAHWTATRERAQLWVSGREAHAATLDDRDFNWLVHLARASPRTAKRIRALTFLADHFEEGRVSPILEARMLAGPPALRRAARKLWLRAIEMTELPASKKEPGSLSIVAAEEAGALSIAASIDGSLSLMRELPASPGVRSEPRDA